MLNSKHVILTEVYISEGMKKDKQTNLKHIVDKD